MIEYEAPVPVIEYIAPAPSVTFAAPSQQLPPTCTVTAVTTGVKLTGIDARMTMELTTRVSAVGSGKERQ